jgi:Asp-tRNA(Asn)/Glu-tRNA(Gln) amidotransferase B subunit
VHEIHRHIDILATHSSVSQETRGFDENTFETFKLRSKEDAPDYRYMPDPNLGTLVLSEVSPLEHYLGSRLLTTALQRNEYLPSTQQCQNYRCRRANACCLHTGFLKRMLMSS